MMSLLNVFWLLLIIFATIGGMRGWAKEILVMFSMVLALFLDIIITAYVPGVSAAIAAQPPIAQFVGRATFFILLAFFGYETPAVVSALQGKGKREKTQDIVLGIVIGALNGYLIIGTLWYYLHLAQYPISGITAPIEPFAQNFINFLPPKVIGVPYIYFAVGLAFVFVIVVFL